MGIQNGEKYTASTKTDNQMLLNSDWCLEVCNITFFQLSLAHFKPVKKV